MPVWDDEIQEDNTRVNRPLITEVYQVQPQTEVVERPQAVIYDKDKADYYRNLQDFYNSNAFVFGISGTPTRLDYADPEQQRIIQGYFDYGKNNVQVIGSELMTGLAGGITRGVLPLVTRHRVVARWPELKQYKIGQGAESIVIDNSPTTVGKITENATKDYVVAKNAIPQAEPVKFIGYTEYKGKQFPTFIQNKLKIVDKSNSEKYLSKLDKIMQKHGYRVIYDPDPTFRTYTNGTVVIDDVKPANIGVTWTGEPKLIDFGLFDKESWINAGFSLRDGGKIIQNFKRKHLGKILN